MKILLTGANGYIGMRLLPVLVEAGHDVTCVVRDQYRFQPSADLADRISVIQYDFLFPAYAERIFRGEEYDVGFFLIHSLIDSSHSLIDNERVTAETFVSVARQTNMKQIVYLSGISNVEKLSPHLSARKSVKDVLVQSGIPYTIFEAGIIVGSGSASFEIIRDLVEKIPVMVGPPSLHSKCQPIAIRNVIQYLKMAMMNNRAINHVFEIGGPDVMSYKDMLLRFAKVRGMKRKVFTIPFITTRFASWWFFMITSINYALSRQLAESMKSDVVCKDKKVLDALPQQLITYEEAIHLAFEKIEQNMVISSWKDAASSSLERLDINAYVEVPTYGCFKNRKWKEIDCEKADEVSERFFGIGGQKGWFYADALWRIRGIIDKFTGGVGLGRGRRSETDLQPGDALDFWRVLLADRVKHRLLLLAEMKLPGEAWLEFAIVKHDKRCFLKQTATFRPKGLAGRLYWISMLPFHFFIFRNMLKRIAGT